MRTAPFHICHQVTLTAHSFSFSYLLGFFLHETRIVRPIFLRSFLTSSTPYYHERGAGSNLHREIGFHPYPAGVASPHSLVGKVSVGHLAMLWRLRGSVFRFESPGWNEAFLLDSTNTPYPPRIGVTATVPKICNGAPQPRRPIFASYKDPILWLPWPFLRGLPCL